MRHSTSPIASLLVFSVLCWHVISRGYTTDYPVLQFHLRITIHPRVHILHPQHVISRGYTTDYPVLQFHLRITIHPRVHISCIHNMSSLVATPQIILFFSSISESPSTLVSIIHNKHLLIQVAGIYRLYVTRSFIFRYGRFGVAITVASAPPQGQLVAQITGTIHKANIPSHALPHAIACRTVILCNVIAIIIQHSTA